MFTALLTQFAGNAIGGKYKSDKSVEALAAEKKDYTTIIVFVVLVIAMLYIFKSKKA